MIRLFVGLGNPGAEYEATRHNAGFWWLERAGRQARRAPGARARLPGAGGAREHAGQGPVWLLEPMTFMNRSGFSVATLARFFKIEPQQILVVHDELDLLPGQAKLKFGGSAAGHNGLKDIHGMLGTLDFWRLRLGIGHPGVKAEVVNYVLKRPSADRPRGHRKGDRASRWRPATCCWPARWTRRWRASTPSRRGPSRRVPRTAAAAADRPGEAE